MRECLGKHSRMSSTFPIVILNGTCFFLYLVQEKLNMPSGRYYRLCSWTGRSNHLILKIYIFALNLQAIFFYNNIIYYLIYPYFLYNITGEGALFFVFRLFKSIFLWIEFRWTFSISYKMLTNYVYYYKLLPTLLLSIRFSYRFVLWHMPHGINLLATPKNNYSYYLLCEQPSPGRIHSFTHHPFLLLQTLFRQE